MPSHFAHHHFNRTDMQCCRLWQKLIFYYYADHYVNFKDLVKDLYKVCLWMSAVNAASSSTNAINHWRQ